MTEHKPLFLICLILIMVTLVIANLVLIHSSPPELYASTIKSYEGIIVDVSSEKITLDGNIIFFANNIRDFDWVLNELYSITIERYWYTTNYCIKEAKILK